MHISMEGINFVTDSNNKRLAVIIDLDKHGELWEDFYDLLVVESRKNEEKVPWEKVKNELKSVGKP